MTVREFLIPKRQSIRAKLILFSSTLTIIVCVMVYYYVPRLIHQEMMAALIDEAESVVGIISYGLGEPLSRGDQDAAEEVLAQAAHIPKLDYAVVENLDGEIFVVMDQDTAQEADYRNLPDQFMVSQADDVRLRSAGDIQYQGQLIGRLYLGCSLADLNQRVSDSRQVVMRVAFLIFLAVHLAVTWISSFVTKPLRLVSDAAIGFTRGDFNSRAHVRSRDEVGEVARAFNLMVDKVAQAYRDLEHANRTLEDRVIERTHDLEKEIRNHKITLRTLREERDRSQTYLDLVEVIMLLVDDKGEVAMINQKGAKVLGRPERQIIGRPWIEFLPDDRRDESRQIIRDLMAGVRDIDEHSEDYLQDDKGHLKLISWHNVVLRDDQGRIHGVLRSGEDITKMRALERQLRHSQKMEAIGTLAGGIAHDFNNILTGIIWCAQLSLEDAPGDSSLAGYQQELLKAANRAKELVQQILTFSRQQEVEKGPTEIRLVIQEALRLLEKSLPKTIQIFSDLDRETGMIMADATQIHQIMMNLGANAYQAMGEEGGELHVHLQRLGPWDHGDDAFRGEPVVRLQIRDTGPGIDETILHRIFDPFFTTKPVDQGTGMGLAVVHGIVTGHGGIIDVESQLNQGAVFRIDFPALVAERTLPEPTATETQTGGGERVLFVDDEVDISKMAAQVLERHGYETTYFTSALEAIDHFAADPDAFEVVITDQVMPEMTGVEFMKAVRRVRADMPFVFITGYSAIVTAETVKEWEPCSYMRKPFTPKELAVQIRAILDRVGSSAGR